MKRSSLAVALHVIITSIGASAMAAEPDNHAPGGTSAATTTNTTGDNWIDTPPANSSEKPRAPAPAPAPRPKSTAPASTTTQSQFVPPQPAPAAAPPAPAASRTSTSTSVDGQWVYTEQYGWVWLPYERAYTYVAPEGYPYMYMYYPAVGWCWLYSPWVVGWGPMPYWGVYGPARFAWYIHPWFRRPIGWGAYYHSGYWHGGYWRGGYGYGGYGHRGFGGGFGHGGWHGGSHRVPAFGGGRGHR